MPKVSCVLICLMAGWLAIAAESPGPAENRAPPRCRRFCATRTLIQMMWLYSYRERP